jgi:hypothetical protein
MGESRAASAAAMRESSEVNFAFADGVPSGFPQQGFLVAGTCP